MKWRVEFNGAVEVDGAETEEAAIRAAFSQLGADGPENILFADADPELEIPIPSHAQLIEELAYTRGIVAQYEAEQK